MRNPLRLTSAEVIISGSVIETFRYEKPKRYQIKLEEADKKIKLITKQRSKVIDKELRKENRKRTGYKAKSNVRRLVHANAPIEISTDKNALVPAFITFTFAENIQNIKSANDDFTKFLKRLTYKITSEKKSFLKYITVIEFQVRGAIHFHTMFFNLPRWLLDSEMCPHGKKGCDWQKNGCCSLDSNARTIALLWRQGYVDVRPVTNVEALGAYVTKYMAKHFDDDRLDGQKRYFRSRRLLIPSIIRNQRRAEIIIKALPREYIRSENDVKHIYLGKYKYQRFQLPKGKKIKDVPSRETITLLQKAPHGNTVDPTP